MNRRKFLTSTLPVVGALLAGTPLASWAHDETLLPMDLGIFEGMIFIVTLGPGLDTRDLTVVNLRRIAQRYRKNPLYSDHVYVYITPEQIPIVEALPGFVLWSCLGDPPYPQRFFTTRYRDGKRIELR